MKDDLHKKISTILLVEDNHDSVFIIQEAIKEIQSNIKLFIVDNGVDAMAFLHRCNAYKDAIRPDIILLDLNLPKKSGEEVLAECKSDDDLKIILIIILTTSQYEMDIMKAYSLNANCYVVKPIDLDQFIQMIRSSRRIHTSKSSYF